jgi:hypothetical protein
MLILYNFRRKQYASQEKWILFARLSKGQSETKTSKEFLQEIIWLTIPSI